jgi:hypothetical protein
VGLLVNGAGGYPLLSNFQTCPATVRRSADRPHVALTRNSPPRPNVIVMPAPVDVSEQAPLSCDLRRATGAALTRFTMFADLDALIRNDASQEPVIVAPELVALTRSLPSARAHSGRLPAHHLGTLPRPNRYSQPAARRSWSLRVPGTGTGGEPTDCRRAAHPTIVQQHRPGNTTTATAFGVCVQGFPPW